LDIELNGARIHYRRSGSGFPVVLLHAGVADSRMWEPQVAGLNKDFDIITPDVRGYGESELPALADDSGLEVAGLGGDPGNRAQKPDSLLGKILRLDVSVRPYAVPADNL